MVVLDPADINAGIREHTLVICLGKKPSLVGNAPRVQQLDPWNCKLNGRYAGHASNPIEIYSFCQDVHCRQMGGGALIMADCRLRPNNAIGGCKADRSGVTPTPLARTACRNSVTAGSGDINLRKPPNGDKQGRECLRVCEPALENHSQKIRISGPVPGLLCHWENHPVGKCRGNELTLTLD